MKKKVSLAMVLSLLMLIVAFVVIIFTLAFEGIMDLDFFAFFMFYLLGIAYVFIAMFIQVIVHESGHLVFGLKSGYKFVSFRIGSFILVNKKGKKEIKKFSLAGTGGQCLLAPPELVDGMMPVSLYNWGGVIFNVIFSTVMLLLGFFFKPFSFGFSAFVVLAIVGYHVAFLNGIPSKLNGVDNDAYNAIHLKEDKEAIKAFYSTLKVNELQSNGYRLYEMPDNLFYLPGNNSDNDIINAMIPLCESRLMDKKDFKGAKRLIIETFENNVSLNAIHNYLMQCDLITIEAMEKGINTNLDAFNNKQFVIFYRSMQKSPQVIRTEYAITLLVKKDEILAEKCVKRIEKITANYAYESELQSEVECMKLIEGCKE